MDGNARCGRWASDRRKAARVLLAVTSPAVTLIAVVARAAAVTELPAASAFRRAVATARRAITPVRGAEARRGNPAALRAVVSRPLPGPLFNPGIWRSPLRGQWLTSLLGLVLLCGLPIVAVTGLLSYVAYDPRLPGNDETHGAPLLKFLLLSWPTQRPRLPGADDRRGRAGGAQHQMGRQEHIHGARVTRVIGRLGRWYGAHPLHLLALLAAFALAGYAARAVIAAGKWQVVALWFLVAIVGHDLLLLLLYSLAGLSARRLLPRRAGGAPAANRAAKVPAPIINHLRVPVGFSLLLLLVWFSLILRLTSSHYHQASGLSAAPYLWRWLALTGVMFLASAVSCALRLGYAVVNGSPPDGNRPESDPSSSAPGKAARRAAN